MTKIRLMQGLQINKLQKLARFISKKSPLIHILINFILSDFEIVTMKFRYEVPSYACKRLRKRLRDSLPLL